MDNFEVVLLSQALKFYQRAPLKLAKKFNKCFEDLEANPFLGPHIKLLKTPKDRKLFRYRVGGYRVIYEIDKKKKRVGVLLISARPSAYKKL